MHSFLHQQGVELVPVHLDECNRFGLDLPALPSWDLVPAQQFPHATAVLCCPKYAVDGFAPNAAVLAGKLTRSLDSQALLACGFSDSRALPDWAEVSYDRDPFCGLPSLSIAGRYDWDGRMLFARTRYVVVHHIVDQYLVQLTVTLPDSARSRLGWAVDEFVDGVYVGHR